MALDFKRGDLYRVPFTKMDVIEGFNKREDYGDIEGLAMSILEDLNSGGEGVRVPLEGFFKGGRLQVTRGHRRLEAMKIIYLRHGIDVVARVTPELRGTTDEQRLLDQELSNNNKEFTPLEKSYIVKELIEKHGYNAAKVAKRMGVTEAYISRLRLLDKAPEALIDLIKKGRIKATLVMDIVKQKKVEEVMDKINSGEGVLEISQNTYTEDSTDAKGRAIKPVTAPKERITNNDIADLNSWKEFKKAAIFIDVKKIESDERKETFKFLTKIANNEFNYDQFIKYFKLSKD